MSEVKKAAFDPTKVEELRALNDTIIVSDMVFDERLTTSGIVLLNDDMKSSGIRPRWAKVYAVGPQQRDVEVGEWVLVEHGRWSRGIKIEDSTGVKTIRKVDPQGIMMKSDHLVTDDTMSDKVL